MGILRVPSLHIVNHSIQLSRHKRYTHVGQVLQDLIQQLGLYVMPTLSGGTHHYGQLHEDSPSSYYQDFPTDPKLDYFRRDLVDGWLTNHQTLPTTYLEIKTYINDATTTLMGADHVKYIWTLTASPSQPAYACYYTINMWTEAVYDLGESLANLERSAGRPSNSERRLNSCRDKLLRYWLMSLSSACSSSQRTIFITARITSLTGSSAMTMSPTFTS